jgi:6-phosphogluconolactonase
MGGNLMRNIRRLVVVPMLAAALAITACGGSPHIQIGCKSCTSSKHFVYVANEGGNQSTLSGLASDATTGALTAIAGSPYNTGSGSIALAKNPVSPHIYVANTFSGDISAFSMNATTGALTPLATSPITVETGVDAIAMDPLGTFLYVVSGNSSNLWGFSIDSGGGLTVVQGMPITISNSGVTSSSVLIDPSGKYLYVAAGSSSSSSIFGFSRNTSTGAVALLAGFPVPLNGQSNHGAFDPSGKFLLVTGNNVFGTAGGLDVFSLNSSTGGLTLASGSPAQVRDDPSGVVVDASGKYVYVPNTADATISAFTLDANGALAPVSGSPFPSGGNGSINGPLGIATDNSGTFIYVANASNDVSVFSINSGTGVLTTVGGSPFPDGGNGPSAIIFVP